MISRNVINSRSGILFIIMMNVSHLLDISLKHVNLWEVLKFYWAKTVMLVTNPPHTMESYNTDIVTGTVVP